PSFAKHIYDLHAEIGRKIILSNDTYKLAANAHYRSREFNKGNYVMVRIYLECYSKMAVKKLHARTLGPYLVLCRLRSNAYLIDLPSNISISPVFNVADLFPYRGTLSLLFCLHLFL
ncbi:hypothetical protein PanWU01x14_178000, partial [Parasponia andersonii]